MKQILRYALLVLLSMHQLTNAQTRPVKKQAQNYNAHADVLNNASIIQLQQAGLGNELIISKIQNSQTNFDVSASGLISLKSQKVDNEIIKAMMTKGSGGNVTGKTTVTNSLTRKTRAGDLPTVEMINYVYGYDKANNKVAPLEKSIASMKTKYKMLGYGGVNVVYNIEGDKSPIRMAQADSIYFIFNSGGGSSPELSLYILNINKKSREALSQKIGTLSGNTGSKSIITYTVSMLKPGVFQLTPSKKLEKGEYFFATKPTLTASSIDVFAFGID